MSPRVMETYNQLYLRFLPLQPLFSLKAFTRALYVEAFSPLMVSLQFSDIYDTESITRRYYSINFHVSLWCRVEISRLGWLILMQCL